MWFNRWRGMLIETWCSVKQCLNNPLHLHTQVVHLCCDRRGIVCRWTTARHDVTGHLHSHVTLHSGIRKLWCKKTLSKGPLFVFNVGIQKITARYLVPNCKHVDAGLLINGTLCCELSLCNVSFCIASLMGQSEHGAMLVRDSDSSTHNTVRNSQLRYP